MTGESRAGTLPDIRVAAGWTFAGLAAGLLAGLALRASGPLSSWASPVLAVTEPVGSLWLKALQMTILPLVSALIFIGVVQAAQTASAGGMARRTLAIFAGVSVAGVLEAAPFLRRLRWRSSVKSSIRAPDWPSAASPAASG